MAAREIEKFRELLVLSNKVGLQLDISKFNNGTYDVTGYCLVDGAETFNCESLEEVEAYIHGYKRGVVSGKVA